MRAFILIVGLIGGGIVILLKFVFGVDLPAWLSVVGLVWFVFAVVMTIASVAAYQHKVGKVSRNERHLIQW